MSQVIKEVAEVLGITLQHATTKHAKTIGMLERTHASLKKTLKIETGERRSMWHKFVNIAVWNRTFPTTQALDENPVEYFTDMFHITSSTKKSQRGGPQRIPTPNSQISEDVLKQTEMIFHDVRKNTMPAYIEYKP